MSDNGIGFDEKYVERIFKPFERLYGSEYPGSGIGLAICRRIAEAHGGMIEARSVPGQGSEFTFVLPAVDVQKSVDASGLENSPAP